MKHGDKFQDVGEALGALLGGHTLRGNDGLLRKLDEGKYLVDDGDGWTERSDCLQSLPKATLYNPPRVIERQVELALYEDEKGQLEACEADACVEISKKLLARKKLTVRFTEGEGLGKPRDTNTALAADQGNGDPAPTFADVLKDGTEGADEVRRAMGEKDIDALPDMHAEERLVTGLTDQDVPAKQDKEIGASQPTESEEITDDHPKTKSYVTEWRIRFDHTNILDVPLGNQILFNQEHFVFSSEHPGAIAFYIPGTHVVVDLQVRSDRNLYISNTDRKVGVLLQHCGIKLSRVSEIDSPGVFFSDSDD